MSADSLRDGGEAILRLAPDCDHTAHRFSPGEGYLLSRVDGYTPWRLLREIGGLPAEEVDLCLENWLAQGILVAGSQPDRAASRPARPKTRAAAEPAELPPIDESEIDDSLALSVEVQRRILEFEVGLARNDFEVLGVSTSADRRAVKKAYFVLCREFHPDRHFRREIGGYGQKLERIFKRVQAAYELLSDDAERVKLAELVGPVSIPGPDPSQSQAATRPSPEAPRTAAAKPPPRRVVPPPVEPPPEPAAPLSARERLRQRMPFRMSSQPRDEGRSQAEQFYKAALVSLRRKKHVDAIASIRLALAFDPSNKTYRDTLAQIELESVNSHLQDIRDNVDKMDPAERKTALEVVEKGLAARPDDPESNHLAARLAVDLGEFARAQEFAERAIKGNPGESGYHATLSRVFEGLQQWPRAIAELKQATRLDPADSELTRRLKALKWRARKQS
jgi:curved DNA-binding protein CbpA